MSLDGRVQIINKVIRNDRPDTKTKACPCGGTIYASGVFAKCSRGEIRCTICLREARRFAKGLTCGVGCKNVQ